MRAGLVIQYTRDWKSIGNVYDLSAFRSPVEFGRRADAAIYIEEARLSRNHAILEERGDDVVVIDMGSANGTFLNGQRVEVPCVVSSGDRITAGATTFLYAAEPTLSERVEAEVTRLRATDLVTRTLSRALLLEWLEREVVEDHANPRATSAVFLEVDGYKETLERKGPDAAVALLRGVSSTLVELEGRFVFRVAGEKFVMLLFETDLGGACGRAERCRQALEDARFASGGVVLTSTATFGVAQLAMDDKRAVDFLRRAERACTEAKRGGRNRVTARTSEE